MTASQAILARATLLLRARQAACSPTPAPMLDTDIEAELSYAYLHAVATQAGFGCEVRGRSADNAGKDAQVSIYERLSAKTVFSDFSIEIQLKACKNRPKPKNGNLPFSIPIQNYNQLRSKENLAPHLLVVLFLPHDKKDWLNVTPEHLVLRECAFWVSLWMAKEVEGQESRTVYIPEQNILSPKGLRDVATILSEGRRIDYVEP